MRGKFFNRICRGNGFYNYYAQRTVHPLLQWCAVLQHGSDGDRQTVVWRYLDIVDNLDLATPFHSLERNSSSICSRRPLKLEHSVDM